MTDKKHSDHPHDHAHHKKHHEEKEGTTNAYKNFTQKGSGDAKSQEAIAELEAQLEKAQEEAKENWEMSLRLQAEMQNIQRRAEQNIEKAHKFGLEKFALSLLPVVDSLEMGLQNSQGADTDNNPMVATLRQGSELTLKLVLDTLKKFNIEVVDPLNQPFDPQFHEAMVMQPSAEVPPNTVLNVVQKGFLLNGRLLRPARVIIAKAP